MTRRIPSRQAVLVFALGLGCGAGVVKGVHQLTAPNTTPPPGGEPIAAAPQPPANSAQPPPVDLAVAAGELAAERDRLCDRLLRRLADPALPIKQKGAYCRALGHLATPKAIDYLIENHTFVILDDTVGPGGLARIDMPCLDALAAAGLAGVPAAVEAYITWPKERTPEMFISLFTGNHVTNRIRGRAAYVYAQGFLFARQEKGHNRDAAIELIRQLGAVVHHGDLPYPPPWMDPPPDGKP